MRLKPKKTRSVGEFLLVYLINVLLSFEWAVIALIMWVAEILLDAPAYLWQIMLGIWLGYPLIVTLVLSALIRGPKLPSSNDLPNKNPYSATNSKDPWDQPKE